MLTKYPDVMDYSSLEFHSEQRDEEISVALNAVLMLLNSAPSLNSYARANKNAIELLEKIKGELDER